jgi:hypothetical protein
MLEKNCSPTVQPFQCLILFKNSIDVVHSTTYALANFHAKVIPFIYELYKRLKFVHIEFLY